MTSDLGVELYSPSGTKSILMNINSGIVDSKLDDDLLLTNAFFEEKSIGKWTLKVIDGGQAQVGKLIDWSLNVFGHRSKKIANNSSLVLGQIKGKQSTKTKENKRKSIL